MIEGGIMQPLTDECAKRRLVDRDEIAVAVGLLLEHGYGAEEIGLRLSRLYYLDIDALNEVLAAHIAEREAASAADPDWLKVA
jgi:hypothetical protein